MKIGSVCPSTKINLRGVEFPADLIALEISGIDVNFGMNWLQNFNGIIVCAKRKVTLTTPSGEHLEVLMDIPQSHEFKGTREAVTEG